MPALLHEYLHDMERAQSPVRAGEISNLTLKVRNLDFVSLLFKFTEQTLNYVY